MIPADLQWLREMGQKMVRIGHVIDQLYLEHAERGQEVTRLKKRLEDQKQESHGDNCKAIIHVDRHGMTCDRQCGLAAGHVNRHWFGDTPL